MIHAAYGCQLACGTKLLNLISNTRMHALTYTHLHQGQDCVCV